MQTLRESDGQSYFYVLWPDERAVGSSRSQGIVPQVSLTAGGKSPAMPLASPGGTAAQLNDRDTSTMRSGRAMADETARAAADPALNYTNQPPDDLGCNATDPANSISQRATKNSTCPSMTQPQNQSNNKQENQISFSGSSSLSSSDNSPISTSQANQSPPPKRYCSSSASIGGRGLDQSRELPVRQMAGSLMPGTAAYFPPLTQCLECEVKDAEIQALRKRIQVNQDHLAMLLSSTENSDNKRRTGTSGTESDSSSSSPAPGSQSASKCNNQEWMRLEDGESSKRDRQPHRSRRDDKHNNQGNQHSQQQFEAGSSVELVHGSGVYISSQGLDEALREAKNGTQLARKLMDAFWDKSTLARSSVSPRSKYQYQQLDPKITAAIESYCLAYDKDIHPKDLHATMTDKCCQCRRGVSRT